MYLELAIKNAFFMKDPCKNFVWTATEAGFDDSMYQTMYNNYLSQLNVENCGAVVAAPDKVGLRFFSCCKNAKTIEV